MSAIRICLATLLILLSAEPAAAAPAGSPTPQPAESTSADSSPAKNKPATDAPAEAKTITVVSVSGRAQKLLAAGEEKKWTALKVGEALGENTIIRTGLGAKVTLKFSDRGEVVVNHATKIGIGEFRKRGRHVKTRLGLKYGTIRASVDSSRGSNDWKIATPVATLSVTGTSGQIAFAADSGVGLKGITGTWRVKAGACKRNVRAGEITKTSRASVSLLKRSIEIVRLERSPRIADAFGGVTAAETRAILLGNDSKTVVTGVVGSMDTYRNITDAPVSRETITRILGTTELSGR